MAEWFNVFSGARHESRRAERMGWHFFEKSNLKLKRQERVLGAARGECVFAASRGALIQLFPDTLISQERSSVPDRKPSMCRT